MRGPRGGFILTNDEEIIKKVNFAAFPGIQGGPLENIIGGKAQCFLEASTEEFKDYIKQVLLNTKTCADEFARLGDVVSGTETHLFLLNTKRVLGLQEKKQKQNLKKLI